MTETIDTNAEFGAGHIFSVGKKDILIRRKTFFKTELIKTIPLKDFVKIELVNPYTKNKKSDRTNNPFRGNHVSIEFMKGTTIAKNQYYTKFKKLEFEELQKAIQESRNLLIST